MIEFPRDSQNRIPTSSVKIIGLGGAGANMLDRVALDGLEGAEMVALNTDVRTLSGSVADERIQLGRNLTKGLGTGGDPELGHQAILEAEDDVRAAVKGRKIVFICVGLGGGTGSGAAPIAARIARQEGAFVVMFATMPFQFEGRRRREQAETALNELAVLSNALVTFDNGRMGELVLAKQGIHEAFAAADRMISESIKAVIRLVVRPGLINIGLDDLMTALRTTRSRCLFGSGLARGKDRAQKALRNALSSPLLDQGALLEDSQSVLVHLCGGEDLTLFEIELLMENLGKHVPANAQVLFGAAVDASMEDQLSITLVSSLPEERLRETSQSSEDHPTTQARTKSEWRSEEETVAEHEEETVAKREEEKPAGLEPSIGFTAAESEPAEAQTGRAESAEEWEADGEVEAFRPVEEEEPEPDVERPEVGASEEIFADEPVAEESAAEEPPATAFVPEPKGEPAGQAFPPAGEEGPFTAVEDDEEGDAESEKDSSSEEEDEVPFAESGFTMKRGKTKLPERKRRKPAESGEDDAFAEGPDELFGESETGGKSQGELSFDGGPKGRFEGSDPSVMDGEDLDVPAFLRKKKS